MKRYLVMPGYVTSRTDGDRHYISAIQLIQLYGVDHNDCEWHDGPKPWWPHSFYKRMEEHINEMILLVPRYDGNYKVPNTKGRVAESGLLHLS